VTIGEILASLPRPSPVTFEFCVATRRFAGRIRKGLREDVFAAFAVNVTGAACKARDRDILLAR